ncbi:MAG: MjaI family restriction endonuclease [Halobacteria archaeon]
MAKTIKLDEDERERLVAEIDPEFPKYTTQIMNTANQNAQATRPKVVGQLSEIIEEFKEKHPEGEYEDWERFYNDEYEGQKRMEKASEKLFDMVEKMREAAMEIDEQMVRRWVEDLVLYKTYTGLGRNEEAIFEKLSEEYNLEYTRSSPSEESKGIDGYLGDQPVSVKPGTYQQKSRLQEDISVPIV